MNAIASQSSVRTRRPRSVPKPAAVSTPAYKIGTLPGPIPRDPLDPKFLEQIEQVRVEATNDQRVRGANQSLANARGYTKDDLFAVAEVAYLYLFGGHRELARVLFEGLAAVAPREPYFALALGLTYDLTGDLPRADQLYRRASTLDPSDARPDVNRAEILLERQRYAEAKQFLARAHHKGPSDPALATKIVELSRQIDRLVKRRAQKA